MKKQQLIKATKKMPRPAETTLITQEEFDSILFNPDLVVIEKHFHNHLETNQVLFVIEDNEIAFTAIKRITSGKTEIYKEI